MTQAVRNAIEALRCPFCGGDALVERVIERNRISGEWAGHCIVCGSRGRKCMQRAEAVKAWNTRKGQASSRGWQPIETAPRDGTLITLGYFDQYNDVERGDWKVKRDVFWTQRGWTDGKYHRTYDNGGYQGKEQTFYRYSLMYWLPQTPLPAAPQPPAEREGKHG